MSSTTPIGSIELSVVLLCKQGRVLQQFPPAYPKYFHAGARTIIKSIIMSLSEHVLGFLQLFPLRTGTVFSLQAFRRDPLDAVQ